MELTSLKLSPAELEKVSGLGTTLQRVWRRRGELPERLGGHAAFSVHDAATISIAVVLNRFGYTPSEAMNVAQGYSSVVVRCALEYGGACEVTGTREDVKKFRTFFDTTSFVGSLVGEEREHRFLYAFDGEPPRLTEPGLENIDVSTASGYFVNLQAIGVRLLTVADRPLFKIRIGSKTVDKLDLIRNLI